MQSQFRLTTEEVQAAVQVFVAKHQRSRNLKVTSFKADENGTFIVAAEVEIKPPQKRAKRTGNETTAKTAKAKTTKEVVNG
jgi:hypothetical protein